MLFRSREIATVYGLPFHSPAERWGGRLPGQSDGVAGSAGAGVAGSAGADAAGSAGADAGWSAGASAPAALPITIELPDLCPRYVGALAEVAVGPSPAWLADRLAACGVRPISNIVDITNYVLLELGQPMHAFDHARLAGPAIVVRAARPGERLTTLDGKARVLDPDMLVIADAERAAAIGGVMGGADSEVGPTTRRIVFEAAWFKPSSVRATSRRLGLRTEASMRFERGADISAPIAAMARACDLLREIGAGAPLGPVIDVYPRPHRAVTLHLPRPRIRGLLGMDVPDDAVLRILTALGFGVTAAQDGWSVTAPPWRVDVHRDVDLVEELGRHHGFEHLPTTFPGVQQAPAPPDPRIARDARARCVALASGCSEAISFAFIEARHAAPFLGSDAPVGLANPLSEKFAVMRPSLVPGLVEAVSHNRRHGRRDIQLFEIGTRFSPRGEARAIALAWTGLATPDHWSGGRRDVDFFDVKGVAEQLASLFGVTLTTWPPPEGSVAAGVLAPGRACVVQAGDRTVGWLGELLAAIANDHDVPAGDAVYVAEIDLDALSAAGGGETTHARPLPRFPTAVRDIAMLLDESLSAATVRGTIQSEAPETLVSVVEFDRYQGKGIPDRKVSLALRLTFQSGERTLTDPEVDAATTAVVDLLARQFGAIRR